MTSADNPLRVLVLGLRGFPGVEGGIETHAEHLYPRLAALGCRVEVVVRSPYQPASNPKEWKGVTFTRIWAPRHAGLEALIHTFLGTLYAAIKRPDVLHIHAIGPALFTPLARLFGLRVVVTHHGPDYEREKWGRFAKFVLKLGERAGMVIANQRIAISKTIEQRVMDQYGQRCVVIPNGIEMPIGPFAETTPRGLGLTPQKYVLQVSRFVPEKRQLDLIHAFREARLDGWKLALVGRLDSTPYVESVKALVGHDPNIVLTGFQSGVALQEIYANAGLFVLPSSHEGLPIALLEAMSYAIPVIASCIPAHLELSLTLNHYFLLGDRTQLAARLREGRTDTTVSESQRLRTRIASDYCWKEIAQKTLSAYDCSIAGRTQCD